MTERNMKGISRIDSGSTHGWFVRIYRNGDTHRKFFGDGPNGGREEALEKAIAHRDAYVENHPSLPFRSEPLPQNSTGVNGVSETFNRSRSGEKIPCFQVFWAPQPGERRLKRFYHHHYNSRAKALKAAAKFRREKEQEILLRSQGEGSL